MHIYAVCCSLFLMRYVYECKLTEVVVVWSVMVALNCACSNFGGLMTLRVLLGCFEAAVAPAYVSAFSRSFCFHAWFGSD